MPIPTLTLGGVVTDSTGKIYFTQTLTVTGPNAVIRLNDMTGAGEVDFGTSGSGIHQFGTGFKGIVTSI